MNLLSEIILINKYLKEKQLEIDNFLNTHLPTVEEKPSIIFEAIRYSIFAGGKRIRPIISLMVNEMLEGKKELVLFPACAIELIHTYSLIHDDLPALDNDDFRRGKESSHKKFGEAIAILSGDALLTMAFQWISFAKHKPEVVVKMIHSVSKAAGVWGMIGGQVADLESEGKINWTNNPTGNFNNHNNNLENEKELEYIHLHKTAALIRESVMIGALTSEANDLELKKCYEFGTLIGLAFQVVDDILDVEGEQKTLGKSIGKDAKSNKLTYPAVYGMEYSKMKAQKLIDDSKEIISYFKNCELLKQLADLIINRQN